MQRIDINVTSFSPVLVVAELFNPNNAYFLKRNPNYNGLTPTIQYDPWPSFPSDPTLTSEANKIYADQRGNVIVNNNIGVQALQISCDQMPYTTLLEQLKSNKIIINSVRLASHSIPQLIQPIVYFQRVPLTDITKQYTYRLTIPPDQVQTDILDFYPQKQNPDGLIIDADSGLYFLCNNPVKWTIKYDII